MRKHMWWAVGVVIMATVVSNAQAMEIADGQVTLNGQARFRYEFANNTDLVSATSDKRDFVITRIRPSMRVSPSEQVSFFLQPQVTAGWGEFAGTSLTSTNAAAGASTSASLNDPAIGVHQAYADYSPAPWLTLRMGRQELVYGDHLVIGNVDWNNTGRSFDAAKMRFEHRYGWVDLFYALLSDQESSLARGTAPAAFTDAHFIGGYASSEFGDWLQNVDYYAFYRLDDTASPKPHNYVTSGVRIKSTPSALDYRFEATGQYGKLAGVNQRDYQADLEVGYTFERLAKLRVAVEGLMASQNYNQLFPTAHKWLGAIDLFGRRNIMGGVIHLSAKPSDQWTVQLDAHTLWRLKTASGLFALNGTTAVGGTGASTAKLAGEELDLSVHYQAHPMVGLTAGVSTFLPMGFVKTEVGSAKPLFGYLQTNFQF